MKTLLCPYFPAPDVFPVFPVFPERAAYGSTLPWTGRASGHREPPMLQEALYLARSDIAIFRHTLPQWFPHERLLQRSTSRYIGIYATMYGVLARPSTGIPPQQDPRGNLLHDARLHLC